MQLANIKIVSNCALLTFSDIIDASDNRCISAHVNLIVLIRLGRIEIFYMGTETPWCGIYMNDDENRHPPK